MEKAQCTIWAAGACIARPGEWIAGCGVAPAAFAVCSSSVRVLQCAYALMGQEPGVPYFPVTT